VGICIIRCRALMMIGQRRPRDLSSGQGNLKPLYFLLQIGLNRAFWGARFRYRQPTRELSVVTEIPKAPASRVHTRQPARLFRGAIMAPRMALLAGMYLGPCEIQSPGSGGTEEVYRTRCTRPRNFFALLRSDNRSAYSAFAGAWLGRGGGHSMHVCMARDRK
jgi:hypothetical protein